MGEALAKSSFARSPRQLAIEVARVLDAKRGEQILVIDVEKLLPITSCFVIVTGSSDRHLKSLAEEAKKLLDASDLPRVGIEGLREGRWICMDFSEVVVHLFHHDVRAFYDLENLWADADRLEYRMENGEQE